MSFPVRDAFWHNGITHFAVVPKRRPMRATFGNGIHIKLECDEHYNIILPPYPGCRCTIRPLGQLALRMRPCVCNGCGSGFAWNDGK